MVGDTVHKLWLLKQEPEKKQEQETNLSDKLKNGKEQDDKTEEYERKRN